MISDFIANRFKSTLSIGDYFPDISINGISIHCIIRKSNCHTIFFVTTSCRTCLELFEDLHKLNINNFILFVDSMDDQIKVLKEVFINTYKFDFSELKEKSIVPIMPYVFRLNKSFKILTHEVYDKKNILEYHGELSE